MKVYVVTKGEYSDYGICAVFSDKSQAQAHAEKIGGNDVEVYEVLDGQPSRKALWVIEKWPQYEAPDERFIAQWDYENSYFSGKPYTYHKWNYGYGKDQAVRVYGQDQERVRKVFYDNWNRERAEAEGIA